MKLNGKILVAAFVFAPMVLTSCGETSVSASNSQGGGLHVISLPSIDPGITTSSIDNSQSSPTSAVDSRDALIESTYQRQDKDKLKISASGNSFNSQFDVTLSNRSTGSSNSGESKGSTNVTGKANRKKGNSDIQIINLQKETNEIQGSFLNSGFFDITDVLVTETKENAVSASEPTKMKDFHDTVSVNAYIDKGYAYLDLTGIVSLIKNYTSIVFPMQKIKSSISSDSSAAIDKQTRDQISNDIADMENTLSKDIIYSKNGSEYSLDYTFDRTDLDRYNLTTVFDSRNRKINLKYTETEFLSLSLSGSRKRNYSKKARMLIIDSMPDSDEKTSIKNAFDAIPLEKATISLTNRNLKYGFAYDSVSPVILKDAEKAMYTEISTADTGN